MMKASPTTTEMYIWLMTAYAIESMVGREMPPVKVLERFDDHVRVFIRRLQYGE